MMKLTSLEIKQQEFEKSFRGYEPAEVQSFLKLMSNEWEHVIAKNRELDQQIEDLQKKIKHYERVEEALHETLQAAKETADTKLAGARKEAGHTIEKAEMQAESIISEAKTDRQKVRESIHRLLDRRKEIIGGLRSYLDVALESVNHFANDDAGLFEMPEDQQEKEASSTKNSTKSSESKSKSDADSSAAPGAENIDDLVNDLD